MWLFCKHGFFSAVEHKDDESMVLVRSRFRGDLERLLESAGLDTWKAIVNNTPDADYAYRMEIPRETWSRIVQEVADDVDYTNFKAKVHEGGGSLRDEAYMGCWMELRRAQEKSRLSC